MVWLVVLFIMSLMSVLSFNYIVVVAVFGAGVGIACCLYCCICSVFGVVVYVVVVADVMVYAFPVGDCVVVVVVCCLCCCCDRC